MLAVSARSERRGAPGVTPTRRARAWLRPSLFSLVGLVEVAALGAGATASGCDNTCTSSSEEDSRMDGTLSYTEANGQAVTGPVGGGDDDYAVTGDASGLEVDGSFVDATGATRTYVLTVSGLSDGSTTDLAGHGRICFQRQADGQPVCTGLTGSMVVTAIASSCSGAAGVTSCAQTLHATLEGASPWEGTTLAIQISFAETAVTSTTACDPDEGS